MKRRERTDPPAVGGSSLLTIFAVLCLSVFALLSLSTAQAESRMAEGTNRAVSAYYEADCRAEEIFARLRNGERVDGVEETDGIYAYFCPISESQTLAVALRQTEDGWQVLRWQAVAGMEITETENLGVWDGGSIGEEEP